MQYTAQDFSKLVGVQGFSETLLKNHFTLYQGYVTNTNKVRESLGQMLKDNKAASPEYAELKRRFGWEFNGMRLHELYFENMKAQATQFDRKSKLALRLLDEFGSVENWEKDFRATGSMRGIGWCVLYQDVADSRLFNCWINEHDVSHPAGCNPILVMDCFEHAYMTDYQLKRADYIESFMKAVNWPVVEGRFERYLQVMKKAA